MIDLHSVRSELLQHRYTGCATRTAAAMSFSSGAQITGLLKTLKEKLVQRSSAVLSQFHSMDKDNSGQVRDATAAQEDASYYERRSPRICSVLSLGGAAL